MVSLFGGCPAILLFAGDAADGPNPNFYRHSGVDIDGAYLLLRPGRKLLLVHPMNAAKARALWKGPLKIIRPGRPLSILRAVLARRSLGLDFASISAQRYLGMRKNLKNRLVDVSEPLQAFRMAKNGAEQACMKKSAQLARGILDSLELHSGMSELDVVGQLARRSIDAGVSFSFPPIVAAGPNSGRPHHIPTSKKLGSGIVLVDFGVKYRHYCSDLSRCYFLGAARDERKKYAECQSIAASIIDGLPECRTAGDIARMADSAVKAAGWPRMIHAVGHGIGLEVHEAPHLQADSRETLVPGVTLAIEPGWYSPRFGVRHENDVILGKKQARLL